MNIWETSVEAASVLGCWNQKPNSTHPYLKWDRPNKGLSCYVMWLVGKVHPASNMDILWIVFCSCDLAHPYLQCGVLGERGGSKKNRTGENSSKRHWCCQNFLHFCPKWPKCSKGGVLVLYMAVSKNDPPKFWLFRSRLVRFSPPAPPKSPKNLGVHSVFSLFWSCAWQKKAPPRGFVDSSGARGEKTAPTMI